VGLRFRVRMEEGIFKRNEKKKVDRRLVKMVTESDMVREKKNVRTESLIEYIDA